MVSPVLKNIRMYSYDLKVPAKRFTDSVTEAFSKCFTHSFTKTYSKSSLNFSNCFPVEYLIVCNDFDETFATTKMSESAEDPLPIA